MKSNMHIHNYNKIKPLQSIKYNILFHWFYGSIFLTFTIFLIAPNLSFADNSSNLNKQVNWEKELNVTFNNVSMNSVIEYINSESGSDIKVLDNVDVKVVFDGKNSAIKILKYVLKHNAIKLITKNGKYYIVNDYNKIVENDSKTISTIILEKENPQLDLKRIIGTVVLESPYDDRTANVWQIVTTNNIVTGHFSFMETDSGDVYNAYNDIDEGTYNISNGYITVKHSYFRYPHIQEDLITIANTFRISGTRVFNKGGREIGIFKKDIFLINENQVVPDGQGCGSIWGNKSKNVFYTAKSKYFKDYPYSDNIKFFCNKDSAINAGYTESLR